jgi:hypothetical protein
MTSFPITKVAHKPLLKAKEIREELATYFFERRKSRVAK